ncbi:mandelate racemase/muconate lactonizing enzyme family protein [Microbacterium sp. QXD-8]|uniref:Mandelate racemase/muconate lactonizing enzyme family protein n=1 Tax=Microbacterium psychrotolerans TaxID=3068321 RepID=A0ABU0YW31_9MICO|nr:mandelate racemase/muconate lactonizing enzyme family protein [Microbacterium sp. QXD-8]MDQ7876530.1 mandelate racemase/muconate lactonizing enzyme family protein [Microbacterium sp. QXD-8]
MTMRIDSVDFFYLSMPTVTLEADGSQDALLVRVTADGHVGWGECEASPLASIAAFVAPRSHGACQPVSASVIGERLDSPDDILRIAALVQHNSMDLLQAAHTFSGIEIALWDLLGRVREEPVWRLLGYDRAHAKTPYASVLFGDTPQETLDKGREQVRRGFRGVKFGWGAFGAGSPADDADQLHAAREAVGEDGLLFVDAGQVWGSDTDAALARLASLEAVRATWIEEPFEASEYDAHARLAASARTVRVAGGEASHNEAMARNLVDYGKVGFLQIDTGRIGGIGPAHRAARYADAREVTFVNHTFTSHLALSASLQPYAGLEHHAICEYPAEPKQLALDITTHHLALDESGTVTAPERPGLGVDVDADALMQYERVIDIVVDGRSVFDSPRIGAIASAERRIAS